jgi:hypothetical protein
MRKDKRENGKQKGKTTGKNSASEVNIAIPLEGQKVERL